MLEKDGLQFFGLVAESKHFIYWVVWLALRWFVCSPLAEASAFDHLEMRLSFLYPVWLTWPLKGQNVEEKFSFSFKSVHMMTMMSKTSRPSNVAKLLITEKLQESKF